MFVFSTTYAKEVQLRLRAELQLKSLTRDWNSLVDKINKLGGENALTQNNLGLTKKEVTKMLMLCHPDKHNGKKMAVEITTKLNKIRANL